MTTPTSCRFAVLLVVQARAQGRCRHGSSPLTCPTECKWENLS